MSENNIDPNEQYGESSFEAAQDAMDVDKAFEEFVKGRFIWWNGLTPNRLKAVVKDIKAFAKFYAKRCGLIINEKQ